MSMAELFAAPSSKADRIHQAGIELFKLLSQGRALDQRSMRSAMERAFGASDAAGAWIWKDAYDAAEVAQVLLLRRFGRVLRGRAGTAQAMLEMMDMLAARLPSQTRRSEESNALQQFSTPLPLAMVAAEAAAMTDQDLVLEPSAGTGLLAIFAEIAGAELALNEIAETRSELLDQLFRAPLSRHDAANIHDLLSPEILPSVVLMNPPFSVAPKVEGRFAGAAMRHVASAFARLRDGGRLVAITSHSRYLAGQIETISQRGRVVFAAAIAGQVYARHGTTQDTLLTVIDKIPAEDPPRLPERLPLAQTTAELLAYLSALPARPALGRLAPLAATQRLAKPRPVLVRAAAPVTALQGEPLVYENREWRPSLEKLEQGIYEGYQLQTLHFPGASPHPTKLVQSVAMAAVAPPKASYQPLLPVGLVAKAILSDAQLEPIVYAGQAHAQYLPGSYTVDDTLDLVAIAPEGASNAVRFRRGYFIGCGTGMGKGRQVAGIIFDNWLKGRQRAVWFSKSSKLIEDAERDWTALGGHRSDLTPLSRFQQGATITLDRGILFVTYATLRTQEKEGKRSRLQQIVDWLGRDFDGVIIWDESHAMQNAGGRKGGGKDDRGDTKPSLQGQAGLRLQHALADARIVYVSATGATTVHNLAYAQRLGLWGRGEFPFVTRDEFVGAIEHGGVGAMEVLARDLKALGLYTSRSLSFEGVEYEIVEHALTPEQTRIYDSYAEAFQIIHQNLDVALQATNIEGPEGTMNSQAKSAALSAFESNKQRFFNYLLTAMKCPTLIRAIQADLDAGHAPVVQIVSTSEALMERRLAEIPPSEWTDLNIDITPREYVLDYLKNSFPVQMHEIYTDDDGNLKSELKFDDAGNPVISREAVEARDRMIEYLGSLPPVHGALDQLIQHFGTNTVAEITGRSRRIVRDGDRLCVQRRPGSANFTETSAFMDDDKRILVFSEAGGIGRSYHADLGCNNQRRRIHYLLEAGWKADAAIQGLGRTNRTNQRVPPLYRLAATDVKGEKRFLSTIARRLDTLGAITRGQRQTGGQGMFRTEDNIENEYARAALRQFFSLIYEGKVKCCSLIEFMDATGLKLCDGDGTLKEELPPISQFLNRMLALTIGMQNQLFAVFEDLIAARVEAAIAGGYYDVGVETLTADSFRVIEQTVVYTHPETGGETRCYKVARRNRNRPLPLADALVFVERDGGQLMLNNRSGHAAIRIHAPSLMGDEGQLLPRVRLIRPMRRETSLRELLALSFWHDTDADTFADAWEAECAALPEYEVGEFSIITGLLLPIWGKLPRGSMRVHRFETDEGEKVIGRTITAEELAGLYKNLGLGVPALSPLEAWTAIADRGSFICLSDDLELRRSLVMGASRIELTGFRDRALDNFKAIGLISEVISWRTRLFVPVDETRGPAIIGALLDRHPVVAIRAR